MPKSSRVSGCVVHNTCVTNSRWPSRCTAVAHLAPPTVALTRLISSFSCLHAAHRPNNAVVTTTIRPPPLTLNSTPARCATTILRYGFPGGLLHCGLNKQAVRVATQYAPPLSSPVGAQTPRAPPSRRNVAVLSHAEYDPTLTAAAALPR